MNETWDNVIAYTTLPSAQEILVVHSTSIKAEILCRDAQGHWPPNPTPIEAGGVIELTSISAGIALKEVYTGTHLVG